VKGTKVLVVGNDVPLRRTIVALLVAWGHRVETASNGVDAWRKVSSFDPQVVISDLNPPLLTAELIRAIHRGVPDVGCIVLTESPNSSEAVDAVRYGARALIEKPPDAGRLRAQLEACLQPLM
jgi:DNA-binding NtrC family response regulator